MNRTVLVIVCAAAAFLVTGCKVIVTGSSTYERCDFSSDCENAFDRCVTVTNAGATDSQCTQTCTFDSDCPGAGHCTSFDGVTSHCYQTCATSSICEPGWTCADLSDGSSICLPGTSTLPPGAATYDACAVSSDCDSALDSCVSVTNGGFTGSQCTRTCGSDLDCPGAGHCVSFDGVTSRCFETCVTSGVCEPAWGCTDLSDGSAVCLPGTGTPVDPGIPAYNECTPGSTGECVASVDGCFTIDADGAVAGVCTSTCSSSRACPLTAGGLVGECIAFDGVNFTCFEACDTSADCLTGFACKSSLADGTTFPPICLPI